MIEMRHLRNVVIQTVSSFVLSKKIINIYIYIYIYIYISSQKAIKFYFINVRKTIV